MSSSLVSTRCESLTILLCQQVWRMTLLMRRMLPDSEQGGLGSWYAYWVWVWSLPILLCQQMHIGCEWQGKISSCLISTKRESLPILLCQQVWRMTLLRRMLLLDTEQGRLGSCYAYWVWVARPNSFQFGLDKTRILAHSALSTGMENYAIEEDNALINLGRIWHNHNGILGWLPCKIWGLPDNWFPRYDHFSLP